MEHFEKSIIPVIESVYPSLTPLERTVADFFIHNNIRSAAALRQCKRTSPLAQKLKGDITK